MPRKPDPTLKPAIIEKVTEHLHDTKLEAVSVRSLGRVLGTSAYPIVYHFGSREALIDAVVEHLDRDLADLRLVPDAGPAALRHWLIAVFGGLEHRDRFLAARLTFELGAVETLDGRERERLVHHGHLAAVAEWCRAHGYATPDAEQAASEAVCAARGAQWAALVDPDGTDVDGALRAIADRLASGAQVPVA
ncbi:TetR/AcrR family transcriptional regulator [Curtobacterium sp. 458]|uniref:TetR/AcrR family transcriptional regulator n=1 Tax=Curtobacterium sp. 458 TaxID=3050069 RepID=UPI0025B3D9CB|nr:TetR/AcrR family transcriptional regulator [Curtobacterium sp. 458]WJX98767.1 TetR/AcrR family transcriptional regulator [Curtobacterium sp. 458]